MTNIISQMMMMTHKNTLMMIWEGEADKKRRATKYSDKFPRTMMKAKPGLVRAVQPVNHVLNALDLALGWAGRVAG